MSFGDFVLKLIPTDLFGGMSVTGGYLFRKKETIQYPEKKMEPCRTVVKQTSMNTVFFIVTLFPISQTLLWVKHNYFLSSGLITTKQVLDDRIICYKFTINPNRYFR